jgi:class 3 adenylate cyclase
MKRRALAAAVGIATLVTALLALFDLRWQAWQPAGMLAHSRGQIGGPSLDVLFWLRHRFLGLRHDPAQSPSVVIAIDEESYRSPPTDQRPHVLWGPFLAPVIDAVIAGGASVVGFDVIFERSIRDIAPDYDREFLRALQRAARVNRVVLAKVQFQREPLRPERAQILAVGGQRNIRSTQLFRDDDEVHRRMPLWFLSDDPGSGNRPEPSIALELAMRAAGESAAITPTAPVVFRGRPIHASDADGMLLNFEGGMEDIPTFSFADLVRCASVGDSGEARARAGEFFRRHFEGRVVLIGYFNDVDDRRITSKRLTTEVERGATGPRCTEPPNREFLRDDVVRDTIPGVLVHATAVNNLIRGDWLAELSPVLVWLIVLAIAIAAALGTLTLSSAAALAAVLGGCLAWAALGTWALWHAWALPLFAPMLAAALTYALTSGYRFAVTDRDKRVLRRSFALYLAPAVVDRLVESDEPPALGGEEREVSVLFSDVADFTSISESLRPAELVSLMNAYLSAMTDIIEDKGGFVDKYIGDAIVAVFGAPLSDPDHARHAVEAALECQRKLAELNRTEAAFRGIKLRARAGINTGAVLLGNIGSRRRFNYTVMGDTVNVASRLEGLNKHYGTANLATGVVRDAARDAALWREVDLVRVKGRDAPLGLFEPTDPAEPGAAARNAQFAQALAAFRERAFERAAAAFGAIGDDPVAMRYGERARALALSPPGDDWEPITNFETK